MIVLTMTKTMRDLIWKKGNSFQWGMLKNVKFTVKIHLAVNIGLGTQDGSQPVGRKLTKEPSIYDVEKNQFSDTPFSISKSTFFKVIWSFSFGFYGNVQGNLFKWSHDRRLRELIHKVKNQGVPDPAAPEPPLTPVVNGWSHRKSYPFWGENLWSKILCWSSTRANCEWINKRN